MVRQLQHNIVPWAIAIAALGSSSLSTLMALPAPTHAAEKVVVRYSPLEQSISVPELRGLADTGKPSAAIEVLLRQTKTSAETIRNILTATFDLKTYELKLPFVERVLNTYLVELILRELGQVVRPPRAEAATVQALRSALVLALADDGKISAIEFLEKYPTDLLVEGDRIESILLRFLKDIDDLQGAVGELMETLKRKQAASQ